MFEPKIIPMGWQCPVCNRVYSPTTSMCYYCGSEQDKTVVNTTGTKVDWTMPTTITGGCDAPEPHYGGNTQRTTR